MEDIKFPLTFDKCPNCGSTRRVANEVLQKQKDEGKIAPGVNAFIARHQSLIVDPRRTWLSAPIITTFYDTCVDCGTLYCTHANLATAMPQVGKKGMPPSSGFSLS